VGNTKLWTSVGAPDYRCSIPLTVFGFASDASIGYKSTCYADDLIYDFVTLVIYKRRNKIVTPLISWRPEIRKAGLIGYKLA
jgi:hypothetical protein